MGNHFLLPGPLTSRSTTVLATVLPISVVLIVLVTVVVLVLAVVCLKRRRRTLKPKPAGEDQRGTWADKVCGG